MQKNLKEAHKRASVTQRQMVFDSEVKRIEENKQEICDSFTRTLQECNMFQDVIEIEYDFRGDLAYVKYVSGLRKVVDIQGKTGILMLLAIIESII